MLYFGKFCEFVYAEFETALKMLTCGLWLNSIFCFLSNTNVINTDYEFNVFRTCRYCSA